MLTTFHCVPSARGPHSAGPVAAARAIFELMEGFRSNLFYGNSSSGNLILNAVNKISPFKEKLLFKHPVVTSEKTQPVNITYQLVNAV
jgi:hypothetical protein